MYNRKAIISIKKVEKALKDKIINNIHLNGKETPKNLERTIIKGESIKTFSDRYKTFFIKGYKCVDCGIQGVYFALESTGGNLQRYHLNLYAVNDKCEEVLMTKDHITPKSKGGKNHITNYQTMCCECNAKKGNN